jgi:hypothetical protein
MQHFYFLLALGALVSILFVAGLVRQLRNRHRLPYRADAFLFSPQQRAFLDVLERAVGRGYRVYGKVRAADIIEVEPRLDRRSRERAYERLADQTFDFVVCTLDTGAIACAVNLAPRSRLSRRPPKNSLDRICAAAKLPFVRFRESEVYSVVEIEQQVFGVMHAQRRRPESKADEMSNEDTRDALRDLSDVIGEREHEPSRFGRQGPAPKPPQRPSTPIPINPQTRKEPRLRVDDDLDMGPEVRIRMDQDDVDPPKRMRM